MTKVLVIQAHPHVSNSVSLTIGDQFVTSYRNSHPNDEIIVRDLFNNGVPPLDDTTMEAWKKQKMEQELTPAEQETIKDHNEWLEEFISADKYIFINPMYNHFLPAELKQYLDVMAVAHKTFKYTSKGPVGLLHNKKAIHIQSAGNIYHTGTWGLIKYGAHKLFKRPYQEGCVLTDLGDLYLSEMLHFFGIKKIDKIFIEGVDAHRNEREQIINAALNKAKNEALNF